MEPIVLGSLITATATITAGSISTYVAYRMGKKSTKREIFQEENKGPGLEKIFPSFDCPEFRALMSKPGKKIIVNTWLYGLDIIGIWLKEALKSEETTIEFVILKVGSEFSAIRSKELNLDVEKVINVNRDFLTNFIQTLSASQRSRIKVYAYDNNPKITIYADGDKAFVSFFWPGTHALTGTQLLVSGKDGYFSEHIWNYYEGGLKIEVQRFMEVKCCHGKKIQSFEL